MMSKRSVLRPLMALMSLIISLSVMSQTTPTAKTDEQALRDLVQQQNDGKDVIGHTKEAILVYGPFPRPMIGKKEWEAQSSIREELAKSRPNSKTKYEIQRLVVSQSGDMAYEFGNHRITYDGPDKKPTGFNGSYLRVWRKINNNWMVDAHFARANKD